MVKMYENFHQTMYSFLGIDELYKLMMNEMYETGHFIEKFKHEYSRICVASVVRA